MGEQERGAILERMVKEDIFKEMTMDQRSVSVRESASSISSRGEKKYKSPEARACLRVFKDKQRGVPAAE